MKLDKEDLITSNPSLAAQWDTEKNGDLTPRDVTGGSGKKVWWCCEKGHSWQAKIASRSNGSGCPICAGRQVLPGFNDFSTMHPELASEWDHEKNGDLTPQDVTAFSNKTVWWLCEKGHSWNVSVHSRSRGTGCPICSGKQVLVGFNDLFTTNPEIAAEWDMEKNGDLTPQDVTLLSNKRVWWRCKKGHSWYVSPNSRSTGTGCPVCADRKQKYWDPKTGLPRPGMDLASKRPDLAAQWDYEKNGGRGPESITAGSHETVWWRCEKGHSWKSSVKNRSSGTSCPICSGRKALPGFNDLATMRPDLAAEWDYEKNGSLTPQDVTAGSNKKTWWRCEKGHSWQATINNRSHSACPICVGQKVLPGFNDLATMRPDLAAEWNYGKNGDLTPQDVTAFSNKKVWWRCEAGHQWRSSIANRSNGRGCPLCAKLHPHGSESDPLQFPNRT